MERFTPEIYLLRHGETEFNRDGRYQGRCDSPLTETGRAQARRAGSILADVIGTAPVNICTSPLERAVRTAGIVADALPGAPLPRIDPDLIEIGMGSWEGMTRQEVREGWPEARKRRPGRNWIFEGPGSEAMHDAMARLAIALARIIDTTPKDGATVVVSHAFAGRLLRGLHAGMTGEDAMCLDAPQEAIFQLCPGGGICRIDGAPEVYQGFQA